MSILGRWVCVCGCDDISDLVFNCPKCNKARTAVEREKGWTNQPRMSDDVERVKLAILALVPHGYGMYPEEAEKYARAAIEAMDSEWKRRAERAEANLEAAMSAYHLLQEAARGTRADMIKAEAERDQAIGERDDAVRLMRVWRDRARQLKDEEEHG